LRVTFDSNVLVYALSRRDRHVAAASLLARATHGDCVQALQSLAECFRVLTAKLRFDPPGKTGDRRLSDRVLGPHRR
jgi:predicted nucleic acid-binding protein